MRPSARQVFVVIWAVSLSPSEPFTQYIQHQHQHQQRPPFGLQSHGNGKPIPPNVPPPERLLSPDKFFVTEKVPIKDRNKSAPPNAINGEMPVGTDPGCYSPRSKLEDEEKQAQAMVNDISAAVSAIENIQVNGSSENSSKAFFKSDEFGIQAPSINTTALAEQFVNQVIRPIFVQDVQSGVPRDTIKGAALTGALLAFLASKGIVVSSAAGLSAAYVAISQGSAGDALRSVGSLAWDFTTATAGLVQKVSAIANKLKRSSQDANTDEMANTLSGAVIESQSKESFNTATSSTNSSDDYDRIGSQEELTRILREAEEAIKIADAAIRTTEGVYADEDDDRDDISLEDLELKVTQLREEAKMADFEEKLIPNATEQKTQLKNKKQRLTEEARVADEARRAKEEKLVDQARLEEAEKLRRAKEQLVENARLLEIVRQKQADMQVAKSAEEQIVDDASVAAEKAKEEVASKEDEWFDDDEYEWFDDDEYDVEYEHGSYNEEEDEDMGEFESSGASVDESSSLIAKNDKETSAADEYDEEWEAAINLAQKNIDGKIVGIDKVLANSKSIKAEWKAAQQLAKELEQGISENAYDDDDYDKEEELKLDMDDQRRAARAGMTQYESRMKQKDKIKADQRVQWNEKMYDSNDVDDLLDDDFTPETDMAELGRAARAAVDMMKDKYAVDDELINGESDDIEFDWEFEDSSDGEFDEEDAKPSSKPVAQDWASMTVAELRKELKSRGLKNVSKKADLVAALQFDDVQKGIMPRRADDDETDEDYFEEDEFELFGDDDMEGLARQARAAVEIAEANQSKNKKGVILDDIDWDLPDVDLTEIGRRARDSVDQYVDADEPSDEVLKQLEDEESILFGGTANSMGGATGDVDYQSMTVPELKDELRKRGLKVSGRKAELIVRLEASS